VVDKVALGQVFLRVLRFSPVSIIPPAFSILIYHPGDEQYVRLVAAVQRRSLNPKKSISQDKESSISQAPCLSLSYHYDFPYGSSCNINLLLFNVISEEVTNLSIVNDIESILRTVLQRVMQDPSAVMTD
jgi:hypothetical protein